MLIYLDIDGVLIPSGTNAGQIHSSFADRLRKILDLTGAKIVVSSTRRRSPQNVKALLGSAGISDDDFASDWATDLVIPGLNDDLSIRGQEIAHHYDRVGPCPYVILDDFPVLTVQNEFHVQPFEQIGLTDNQADTAIDILNSARAG